MNLLALGLTTLDFGGLSCEWCMPAHLEVNLHQIVQGPMLLVLVVIYMSFCTQTMRPSGLPPDAIKYIVFLCFTREGYVKLT